MPNFDLSALALAAVCPGNEILYDDKGMPSIMVRIPKQTYAQLGLGESTAVHPAFIVNGKEVDEVYISKYQNIVKNGRAYSLPAQDPQASIDFDTSRGYCEAKGLGWHTMTRAEWSLLALWCKQNNYLPYGNNNYGKDTRETNYKAIPTYKYVENGKEIIGRVATGTGPLTWSHDKSPSGIWDLNGNVWEWQGGIRTVYGELQVLVNNNAADSSHSQSPTSTEWMAVTGAGLYVTPNGLGTTTGSIKLDYVSNAWKWVTGTISSKADSARATTFESVTADASVTANALLILKSLGLIKHDPTSGVYEGDTLWANNGTAERFFFAGGSWFYGVGAGLFCLYGYYPRSCVNSGIGCRSAFVKLPTV